MIANPAHLTVPSKLDQAESKVIVPSSLTEIEIDARNSPRFEVSMADGHAAQYDEPFIRRALGRFSEFMFRASQVRDREAESSYVRSFMEFFELPGGLGNAFKIQPNASASINTAMSICARRQWRTALIEPCFDNLALYGKERGVKLVPLPEQRLREDGAAAVDTAVVDAIALVSPNNPTGWTMPQDEFKLLADRCARAGTVIMLDTSFRAYDRTRADHYAILKNAGCRWIVIEDTGKLLSTHELKASIISCSNDLRRDLFELVEIDTLGVSTPVLLLLTTLLNDLRLIGLETAVHQPIELARKMVRDACRGTFLRPSHEARDSCLPVELLEVLDDRYDDLTTVRLLGDHGLGVLPGRHFYWSGSESRGERQIRLSLLKRRSLVEKGAELLRKAILAS